TLRTLILRTTTSPKGGCHGDVQPAPPGRDHPRGLHQAAWPYSDGKRRKVSACRVKRCRNCSTGATGFRRRWRYGSKKPAGALPSHGCATRRRYDLWHAKQHSDRLKVRKFPTPEPV